MNYNKDLLKSWLIELEDDPEFNDLSDEEIRELRLEGLKFYLHLNRKIEYCKNLAFKYKDAFLYYVLAELYDRYDFSHCRGILYKRAARYYCIMAIRRDRNYTPAWALLSAEHWWLSVIERTRDSILKNDNYIEDDSVIIQEAKDKAYKSRTIQIKHIEKAIYYIRKVLKREPLNKQYQAWHKFYCQERNEIYGYCSKA
jgi:hypothetical protein